MHETHEFSWSSLLTPEGDVGSTTSHRIRKTSTYSIMTAVLVQNEDREYSGPSSACESDKNQTKDPLGPTNDLRKSNLYTQAGSVKISTGLPGPSSVKEISSRPQSPNNPLPEGRPSEAHLNVSSSDVPKTRQTSSVYGDSHQDAKHISFSKSDNDRFNLLPDDRRPEPTAALAPDENEEPDKFEYIPPEPLSLPSIGRRGQKVAAVLPDSSRVPSYLLASANRFTGAEIDNLAPLVASSLRAPPLFVYGSFMFPSIVKAQARKSIRGIYSSRYQRRLVPDPIDWARASRSLKNVAEIMTPAVLMGYDRWKPEGLECAAIVDSGTTKDILSTGFIMPKRFRNLPDQEMFPGHVQGFLLFGLSEEVFKSCDESFPLDHYSIGSEIEATESKKKKLFRRKTVTVDVRLSSGQFRTLDAVTYVWAKRYSVRGRHCGLEGPWDINNFIKRACFNQWSLAEPGDREWATEEAELANTMKMTYILVGDPLGHAISEGNLEAVQELLADGDDVNGVCRPYGTPLQTAVVTGDEEMVRLLLKTGAYVNTKGGKYQTPLLAAVLCGHEEIVALLLRHKADVLTECGFHVSALYQAVSHSDESIAHLLLEHGAWLSKGYAELLDLAAERGNHRIMDMLMDYDVRRLHLALPTYHGRLTKGLQPFSKRRDVALISGKILRAVISQVLILKGSSGKWQGRKGVLVLNAALDAGAEEEVIDLIGVNLMSISGFIDFFRSAAMDILSTQSSTVNKRESIAHNGRAVVKEIDSSSDEVSEDDDATRNRRDRTGTHDGAMTTVRPTIQFPRLKLTRSY